MLQGMASPRTGFSDAFARARDRAGLAHRGPGARPVRRRCGRPARGRVVEIGSHHGRSTVVLAAAACAHVVAVDPFPPDWRYGGSGHRAGLPRQPGPGRRRATGSTCGSRPAAPRARTGAGPSTSSTSTASTTTGRPATTSAGRRTSGRAGACSSTTPSPRSASPRPCSASSCGPSAAALRRAHRLARPAGPGLARARRPAAGPGAAAVVGPQPGDQAAAPAAAAAAGPARRARGHGRPVLSPDYPRPGDDVRDRARPAAQRGRDRGRDGGPERRDLRVHDRRGAPARPAPSTARVAVADGPAAGRRACSRSACRRPARAGSPPTPTTRRDRARR